jgi:predicted deacetylase
MCNNSHPIQTIHLFAELDRLLIELLRSLEQSDWHRQTIAPQWKVHDVALHLLDGNLRTLSMLRDQYNVLPSENIETYQDLVKYLNRLNADWIVGLRRLSPQVVIQLLEQSGKEYTSFLQSLDPYSTSRVSVAWAGEIESQNWFHIAREYTENWHHQQQIRLTVGKEDILYQEELYYPYLETSMRALPYHYRSIKAEEDHAVKFTIDRLSWFLVFTSGSWKLSENHEQYKLESEVKIVPEIAWRIFTKGINKELAKSALQITGNQKLGDHIVDMLAVMA